MTYSVLCRAFFDYSTPRSEARIQFKSTSNFQQHPGLRLEGKLARHKSVVETEGLFLMLSPMSNQMNQLKQDKNLERENCSRFCSFEFLTNPHRTIKGIYVNHRFYWSGRRDSNPRPSAPKTDARFQAKSLKAKERKPFEIKATY